MRKIFGFCFSLLSFSHLLAYIHNFYSFCIFKIVIYQQLLFLPFYFHISPFPCIILNYFITAFFNFYFILSFRFHFSFYLYLLVIFMFLEGFYWNINKRFSFSLLLFRRYFIAIFDGASTIIKMMKYFCSLNKLAK